MNARTPDTAAARPPDILLITSDQHRGDCYGFAGRRVSTPHLDLLRAQGTWLRRCITPNVVCQPARASMLTGLLPSTHGVCDNGIDLPEEQAQRGFAAHLARHGWHTAFIGKAHFSTYKTYEPTGRPECIESSAQFGPPWCGPYMGFRHTELMLIGHNWFLPEAPPRGLHYERWYHGDGLGELKHHLYRTALPPDTGTPQTFHSALPVAWHNSTWVADRTVAFLTEQARSGPPARDDPSRGAGRAPFLLWASFPDPHHPFDAPVPWSRLHDPADVDLPPHRARDLDRRPWWHRAALERASTDRAGFREVREQYSRMPVLDDRQLRELTANYYGMISLVDHNVGRILTALHDLGLASTTRVVFTADHGDWLGDHGLVLKGPMMYDGLLRVGALVRGPGIAAGGTVEAPVSTLDLAATFSDWAGVPAPTGHGRSWTDVLGGADRDAALNEWALGPQRCGVALDLRTVRTRRYRMTFEAGSGAGELYDLDDDPHETVNRYDDLSFAALRAELHERLAARPDDRRPDPLPRVGQA